MKLIKNHLTNGQYVTEKYEKKSVFLHHTVGLSAKSAWRWWNSTPDRVGTAFIIDRDGVITECFEPSYWAYHLGIKGDDNFQEKHSIGIELVSAGPLYKEGEKFRFYPLWPNKSRYNEIPKSEVTTFSNFWRGHQYYHSYTIMQIQALGELLKDLYEKFPSLVTDIDTKNWYQFNEEVVERHLGGIWAHTTVRADKSDIYPDKDLIQVISEFSDIVNPTKVNSNKGKKKFSSKKS